jgi:hypothetical protein
MRHTGTIVVVIWVLLCVLLLAVVQRGNQQSCERFNISQSQRAHIGHIHVKPLACPFFHPSS